MGVQLVIKEERQINNLSLILMKIRVDRLKQIKIALAYRVGVTFGVFQASAKQ